MEQHHIKVGITQGDINGTGYEIILKAFEDPTMLELCTPVVFGSPKVAAFHKKVLGLETSFCPTATADEAPEGVLSMVNSCDDEVKVDLQKTDPEAGAAAFSALKVAVEELQQDMFDTLVLMPSNASTRQASCLPFLRERLFQEQDELPILSHEGVRVAIATPEMPLMDVQEALDQDTLRDRILCFEESLQEDFSAERPRIAVLSLNPGGGREALPGEYEKNVLMPLMEELSQEHLVYGPYSMDYLLMPEVNRSFDGILALYWDQGQSLFRALSPQEGAMLLAGNPDYVVTLPLEGCALEMAGKNLMNPDGLRQAVYLGMDVLRSRRFEAAARRNPLRKQYFDRRDDSDKLKQLQNQEDEI